jgi:hypothetical protein
MYCPACGALNEETATFCGSCGTSLEGGSQLTKPGTEVPEGALEEGREAATGVDAAQEGLRRPTHEESGTVVPPAEEVPAVTRPAMAPLAPVPPAQPRGGTPVYATPSFSAPTSGLAIAALIFSIGGLTFLPLLGSIVGVILGYMARSDIRRRPEQVSGDGMALVSLILGWIGIGLAVLGGLLFGTIAVCGLCGALGAAWPAY